MSYWLFVLKIIERRGEGYLDAIFDCYLLYKNENEKGDILMKFMIYIIKERINSNISWVI